MTCCRMAVALTLCLLAGFSAPSAHTAERAPNVVATIVPVHALVAGVMEGVGEPALLVRRGASPHDHQLRPSDSRALQEAELVVWVGPALEGFMPKALSSLASDAETLTLMEAAGVDLLPARQAGDLDGGEAAHGHGHGEDAPDPHVWLSPSNARAMVQAIADALGRIDPARAAIYRANAARMDAALIALAAELQAQLAPVRDQPFVVFHDAYQYLEHVFGLNAAGSITVSPERLPGARRLTELRRTMEESGARCIFGEAVAIRPVVSALAADTGAEIATLDAEGVTVVEPGPDAYMKLMRSNARAIVACLSRGR